MERYQIYEQLNGDLYLPSERKRQLKKDYETLVEKEASIVTGSQPTLQPHYIISVGNQTYENKMIQHGEIVEMSEEPPLLVESIKLMIKEFDRDCFHQAQHDGETDCSSKALQKMLMKSKKKRLTLPLHPVFSEDDFKSSDEPTDKWEAKFGMDNVFRNMEAYRKFKVKATLKFEGKPMKVLESYIDALKFPLYKFGIARSSFPVEAVAPRVLEFSEVKMDDDMVTPVHHRQLHRRKTAWLVSMYSVLASKLSCLCKLVNETAQSIASMCYHQPKPQEAYNKRAKTIYEGTKSLPKITKPAFQEEAVKYLTVASARDVSEDPVVLQFVEVVKRDSCTVKDVTDLLLLEPVDQYARPYSEMNLKHKQYKRLFMSFIDPLLLVQQWRASIGDAKTRSSANKATQTAYVLRWLGEVSMHFGAVKLDFSLIDDETIQGSLVNGLRQQLCDYLEKGTTSLLATFPENEKGVKEHTKAFLQILFNRAMDDAVDYGAIDVVRLDRMTTTMSELDYATAFEVVQSFRDDLTREEALLILEIMEPQTDDDKELFASLCYELAIDLLHSDHVATAVKYFEHSLSYDPVKHDTRRRRVTYQILATISEMIGDQDDAAFYRQPNKLKPLPPDKFKRKNPTTRGTCSTRPCWTP
jgi:hypothetical protein